MPIYREIYDGPPRWYGSERTTKRYIAIHSTENDASAEGEAAYAKRREDSTSSSYYVDRDSIVQSLDTDLRAFHAGSRTGNSLAIAYELTGRASWSRSTWLGAIAWDVLAAQIAVDARHWGIEPRDLSVEQLRAGDLTGIITHNDMRLVWGGTDHWDPGPDFPMDHLVDRVRAAMGDDMPTADEVASAILGRRVKPTTWMAARWPDIPDEGWTVGAYIRAAYGYGRALSEDLDEARASLAAARAQISALAEQVADVGPVDAAGEQVAAQVLERLADAGRALAGDV